MQFKDKNKTQTYNPFLSISQNLRKDLQTKSFSNSKVSEQTKSDLKQILVVYVNEQERFYINRSAAYAIGLMDTRARQH